jgi:apolipoprotein D and lipocalin family protein
VGPQFFTGRWFEIARSINPNQKDCEAPTYDFAPQTSGGPRFTLTCRKGSPSGPADRLNVGVRLPKSEDAARFRVSALGGLVGANYVVLDHDEAYSWALLTMGDGQLVWFLARRPTVDEPTRAQVTKRMAALGYDLRRLVYARF